MVWWSISSLLNQFFIKNSLYVCLCSLKYQSCFDAFLDFFVLDFIIILLCIMLLTIIKKQAISKSTSVPLLHTFFFQSETLQCRKKCIMRTGPIALLALAVVNVVRERFEYYSLIWFCLHFFLDWIVMLLKEHALLMQHPFPFLSFQNKQEVQNNFLLSPVVVWRLEKVRFNSPLLPSWTAFLFFDPFMNELLHNFYRAFHNHFLIPNFSIVQN